MVRQQKQVKRPARCLRLKTVYWVEANTAELHPQKKKTQKQPGLSVMAAMNNFWISTTTKLNFTTTPARHAMVNLVNGAKLHYIFHRARHSNVRQYLDVFVQLLL